MSVDLDPFNVEAQEGAAFFSTGNVAAKFPRDGFTVEGNVTGWRMLQQSDIDTRELLFLYNGKATKESQIPEANGVRARVTADPRSRVMQMVIDLECEPTGVTYETLQYIEKELPEDDGMRALYVKGQLRAAIGKELQKAGHRVPEAGARLRVTRVRTERVGEKGKFTKYVFSVQYTPAAQNPQAAAALLSPENDPFGGFE